MHCYIKNGETFVNDLDLKRFSREIKKALGAKASLDQAQEVVAKSLGFKSYYHLRKTASAPDVSSKMGYELNKFFRENLLKKGEKFPAKLPAKFDASWKRKSMQLIESALAKCSSDAFEFVALVGSPGSGKTLLAQDLCYRLNGRLIDVGNICTPGLNLIPGAETSSLLVLDQSVEPIADSSGKPRDWWSTREQFKLWDGLPKAQKQWSRFIELTRMRALHIPEYGDFMFGLPTLRACLRRNRDMRIVICFANADEARHALQRASSVRTNSKDKHLAYNWNRAHVVDLDAMVAATIENLSPEPLPEPTEDEKLRTANWIKIG